MGAYLPLTILQAKSLDNREIVGAFLFCICLRAGAVRAGRIRFCGEIRYFMGYGRCGRCGKPGRPRTGGFKFFLIFVADSV